MVSKLVGRKKEQDVLEKALKSDEAEMVSVIGRRRIVYGNGRYSALYERN